MLEVFVAQERAVQGLDAVVQVCGACVQGLEEVA